MGAQDYHVKVILNNGSLNSLLLVTERHRQFEFCFIYSSGVVRLLFIILAISKLPLLNPKFC